MSRSLWVYKCNINSKVNDRVWGDWNEFLGRDFDKPEDFEWGGTWGIKNPVSVNILRTRMSPGDLILAYQTDSESILAVCEVIEIEQHPDGETGLRIKVVESFLYPIYIHKLREKDLALQAIPAFAHGFPQTFYETSEAHAKMLLAACGAKTKL